MSVIDWSKAPEGTTHYLPETDEQAWFPCWVRDDGGEYYIMLCDGIDIYWDHDDAMDDCIPHLVPRPSSPAWNGESLPAIGTVCEAFNGLKEEWIAVKIIDHGHGPVAACREESDRLWWSQKFRPIRTPEQKAAEEREAAIEQILSDYEYTVGPCTHKLCRSQAERIYLAGYRKVEQSK